MQEQDDLYEMVTRLWNNEKIQAFEVLPVVEQGSLWLYRWFKE
jgi:hypothetical protein